MLYSVTVYNYISDFLKEPNLSHGSCHSSPCGTLAYVRSSE